MLTTLPSRTLKDARCVRLHLLELQAAYPAAAGEAMEGENTLLVERHKRLRGESVPEVCGKMLA